MDKNSLKKLEIFLLLSDLNLSFLLLKNFAEYINNTRVDILYF